MRLGTFTPRAKYGNRSIVIDGEKFDSLAESRRWRDLLLLQRAGKISRLQRQVRYILLDAIPRVGNKPGQRAISYVADFAYWDEDGRLVVEDVKGVRTEVYRLKAKLMRAVHGIEITEVLA
jgi:hypothetical protein